MVWTNYNPLTVQALLRGTLFHLGNLQDILRSRVNFFVFFFSIDVVESVILHLDL